MKTSIAQNLGRRKAFLRPRIASCASVRNGLSCAFLRTGRRYIGTRVLFTLSQQSPYTVIYDAAPDDDGIPANINSYNNAYPSTDGERERQREGGRGGMCFEIPKPCCLATRARYVNQRQLIRR